MSAEQDTSIELIAPDRSRQVIRIAASPFLIGRGSETGNHVQLNDRRISRQCAAIVSEGGHYYVENRGQKLGLFVNGEKVDHRMLNDGDVISFGLADSYEMIFRSSSNGAVAPDMMTLIGQVPDTQLTPGPTGGLSKLNLLLEASMLLHSTLPLQSVLSTVLDHAIAVTDADRALLLEPGDSGSLQPRFARGAGLVRLPSESFSPSQTALRMALDHRASIITEDLAQADSGLQAAQSIVSQQLRAVVVIPLYAGGRTHTTESGIHKGGDLLGALYLDSRRRAAFSKLDRQILDALAVQAASILDNARMVERERQRQRLEQEVNIARDIQQALLPRGLRDFPHLKVAGINIPCLAVGGDYFDVFKMADGRTAFLIADVSGKGLGAALLTTMLQGALSGLMLGADPAPMFVHLNNFLCEHAEVGRYATVFFGILHNDGTLEYINAGHPSPLLLRGGAATEPFTEGSCPVGLLPEIDYHVARVKLEPNDTLILFSDGITEAVDMKEEMYGIDRLRALFAGQANPGLDYLQQNALASLRDFTRGASQADDITLLLVRYQPSTQETPPAANHN
ncbi:MAG TPA: SpoIIE family protein phosphatase [Candidatus Baltobacteraceae bacterium]|jgi:phosphoserine phosphatase RsbU/P|nr:SpoIIE family protein phosphatase [Candidatus Baltobacteraceae bacterium]